MIVVTGATGQLGRGVVEGLLRRLPASLIAAAARDPAKAAALAGSGVAVRRCDFAEPEAVGAAFAGADSVLVVSVDQLGEPALRLHRAAIEAARAAGVRRIFYTGHMGARADSPFVPARDHAAVEEILAASGLPFTALRHGFYAESALHMVGGGIRAGEIRAPEDGPVSWTLRADLAEADAALLAGRETFDGATPPLTAPHSITMAELAAVASEVAGRRIGHVVLSDAAWTEEAVARGMPAFAAELLLGAFRAARRGDFAATDPTLGRLLGRPPRGMGDAVADMLKPAGG